MELPFIKNKILQKSSHITTFNIDLAVQNATEVHVSQTSIGDVCVSRVSTVDEDLDELSKLLECDTLPEVNETNNQTSNKYNKTVGNAPAKYISDHSKSHEKSEIHNGDTDSSDDEDNKYTETQTYTESGRAIKNVLKKQSNSSNNYFENATWKSKKNSLASFFGTTSSVLPNKAPTDIYSDPYFGIRIITPLVSSQVLRERMAGKTPVTFSKLEKHIQTADKSGDWVVAGVIVSKFIKTSQKGNPYACWTISDLREGLNTVSVFLFGKAYKELWKTSTHVVVGILNASPLDNRKTSRDIAALSVLNPDQVMIWGQSKDFGICKARKKNGEPCTSFVNKNHCEFCVYHVKQEYRKFTGRAELQAPSGGSLTALKNKVLGKNEVFYAGKSFTAVPSKPNRKQTAKDKVRLNQLFNNCESRFGPEPLPMAKAANQAQSARVKLMKDAERLQKLTGSPATLNTLMLDGLGHEMSKKGGLQHCPANKSTTKSLINGKYELKKERNGQLISKFFNNTGKKLNQEQSPSTPINVVEKLKEKRLLNVPAEISSKNKPDSVIISTQQQSKTPSGKKIPTKSRFENLTKLSSVHSKTNEYSNTNKTISPPTPKQQKSEVTNMIDVNFDFDNESENKIFSGKTITPNKTHSLSQLKANNLEGQCIIDSLQTCKGNRQSNVSGLTTNIKIKDSSQTSPSGPLCERKPPTKHETKLNSTPDTRNHSSSARKLENVVSAKKSDLTSPECPTKRIQDIVHTNTPRLSNFGSLTLNVPVRSSSAKMKALKYIKLNGPIKKDDPDAKKDKGGVNQEKKRKRMDDSDSGHDEATQLSQRFIELMNASSKHQDLISNAENEAIDDYYDKMEKKEKMEEKMLTTFKIDCKAYRCLKCKYKWFAPSELCKAEKHPIKVISAVKRFFECHNCRNRTVSLEVIPMHNCGNCGQANWKRAAMMREKKSATVHLSIRGGEQTFVNSVVTDTNLDLLVPD